VLVAWVVKALRLWQSSGCKAMAHA
jgi:hypothetical protein